MNGDDKNADADKDDEVVEDLADVAAAVVGT
jgi:hypothetical protein